MNYYRELEEEHKLEEILQDPKLSEETREKVEALRLEKSQRTQQYYNIYIAGKREDQGR